MLLEAEISISSTRHGELRVRRDVVGDMTDPRRPWRVQQLDGDGTWNTIGRSRRLLAALVMLARVWRSETAE